MFVVPHKPEVELASRDFFAVFDRSAFDRSVFDRSDFAVAFVLLDFVADAFEVRLAEEEPKTEELPNVSSWPEFDPSEEARGRATKSF
ncbi:MAG: hypothetical protein RL240_2543 [Planctomycetota bacterium]